MNRRIMRTIIWIVNTIVGIRVKKDAVYWSCLVKEGMRMVQANRRVNRARGTKLQRADEWWAYLFIAPQFLGIMAFTLFPAVAAIFISFTKWDFINFPRWIGMANYRDVLSDKLTLKVILNTLYFIVGNVPFTLGIALCLALMLDTKIRGVVVFRTAFFLPSITSAVAVSLVWSWLLNPEMGLVNAMLMNLGLPAPGWMASLEWAMPSVILVAIWQWSGYNAVILLAGLKAIPSTYTEAARIDGANAVQTFFKIRLPMLTPSLFFVLTMMLINGMQVFSEPYMMTSGGPADATNVLVLQIYTTAFQFFNMGHASVLSIILFAICMLLTVMQFRLQEKWVNYDV